MRRNGNGPVVAIDIDGTIGNFHEHFLKFAEGWYGRPMPRLDDMRPDVPLFKAMQTSKATYRKCKLAYRQGGLKRNMPIYPGARELTVSLRRKGAEVWLCTTRPYLSLDNIEPDTRHWLSRHKIQYDGMLFGPNKYHDLVRQVGKDRVVAVLDDLPEMLDQAISLGLVTVVRDQPYNRDYDQAFRARGIGPARAILEAELLFWRERHAS